MIDILKNLFIVYDETKTHGWRLSKTMMAAAVTVVSALIVRFTPITEGLSDAQIADLANYMFMVGGILVGWLRVKTEAPVALHDVSNGDDTGVHSSDGL